MSEYRNNPPIDFLLDKGSEDYANRYDQHIHAMTDERLTSKSDIAWELTIRDQRIAKLEAKNRRLVELVEWAIEINGAEYDALFMEAADLALTNKEKDDE